MDADHVEPLVTDGNKAMRCFRSNHDDVAGTGNLLFSSDNHCHPAGTDNASFGIWMLMQSRAVPGREVADEKGNAGIVRRSLEFHCCDCAFPLIAPMQDTVHRHSLN